jgi:hypothetical protein
MPQSAAIYGKSGANFDVCVEGVPFAPQARQAASVDTDAPPVPVGGIRVEAFFGPGSLPVGNSGHFCTIALPPHCHMWRMRGADVDARRVEGAHVFVH